MFSRHHCPRMQYTRHQHPSSAILSVEGQPCLTQNGTWEILVPSPVIRHILVMASCTFPSRRCWNWAVLRKCCLQVSDIPAQVLCLFLESMVPCKAKLYKVRPILWASLRAISDMALSHSQFLMTLIAASKTLGRQAAEGDNRLQSIKQISGRWNKPT